MTLSKEIISKLITPIVGEKCLSSVNIEKESITLILDLSKQTNKLDYKEIEEKCQKAIIAEDASKEISIIITDDKRKQKNKIVEPKKLKNIDKIIAVASGKGGVGKSTMASNLSTSLVKEGFRVGLVDADIYGPSIAKMMGSNKKPKVKNNQMIPEEKFGVKIMSMGSILKEEDAVVWRGPMVSKALSQLMLGANWGELDYLIIDLPPGTGDVHLSIAQNFSIDGVIMVSTPQELALLDVKKAIDMFTKVNTPILGIIENMSYFIDEKSRNKTYIFGKGNVKKICKKYSIPYLAEIPILCEISKTHDSGKPFIAKRPKSEIGTIFSKIAKIL